MTAVDVIVSAQIDDPLRPSGGNRYDRRVCDGLRDAGWRVREVAVAGEWPVPADALARALMPDAAGRGAASPPVALIDGMLASNAGEVVAAAARRRPVVMLVHMLFGAYSEPVARSEALALRSAHALIVTSAFSAAAVRGIDGIDPERVHIATPGADRHVETRGADGRVATRVADAHAVTPIADAHVVAPIADAHIDAARPTPADTQPTPADAPSAVDHARPAALGHRPVQILCPAAVTAAKGLDTLVAALAALHRDAAVPDWSCTCAGRLDVDPAFVAELRGRIAGAGLDAHITLAGALDERGMDAAYAAADLVVLPSRAETWGLVVTEALSRGIPVVAADVGGVPEALGRAPDGTPPGLLIPPGDADALVAALRAWLTDADLRHRLRVAAHARATTLPGWDRTADAVARVLTLAAHAGTARRAS